MLSRTATAISCANIALIKYWGNRDEALRLPANGSISMNLGGLTTQTQVRFDPGLNGDRLVLNGVPAAGQALQRVSEFLSVVRELAKSREPAEVISENNFPAGAGIASSASAFAALSLAASTAAGLELDEAGLSRLARRGSGSACRSIPGGFVEWRVGDDCSSFASSLAPASHWDLADCVAVVSRAHKDTGSSQGHALASTSPLQEARVAGATGRLDQCRQALLSRDFDALAQVAELDSNLMHAVMMTSRPPVLYWRPATLGILQAVQSWRRGGLPVFFTIDAGPNVHVLCPGEQAGKVAGLLQGLPGVLSILIAHPGGPAHLL